MEERPGLVQREIGGGHDQVGRLEIRVVEKLALVAHKVVQLDQAGLQPLLVTSLERLQSRVVDLVQSLRKCPINPVLALTHQTNEHDSPSLAAAAEP